MKQLIILTTLFMSILCHSENICMKNYSNTASETLFKEFVDKLKHNCNDSINIEHLQIDNQNLTFKSDEQTIKIKKKSPAIGILPDIPKAKWKTQKLSLKGYISDSEICLSFNSTAYNKKDKQWHPVKAPFYIEDTVQSTALKSLIGKQVWSIGNPVVFLDDINTEKPKNLTHYTVEDASVSFGSVRGVIITLKNNHSPAMFNIPFVGDILNTGQAIGYFSSKFLDFNPKSKVNKDFDYFWEVARHGDIMDGMHKLQLITAIGYPLKKVPIKADQESWEYNLNGKTYSFTLVADILVIPDDFSW